MGWLDFLFRPPSRDRFARLVMEQLRQAGGDGEMKFDANQFLIERGGAGFINLANLYQEYCQAPREQRDKVLARFIRGCVGTSGFELPEVGRGGTVSLASLRGRKVLLVFFRGYW